MRLLQELMSPREQRFVPQYPFATRALQDLARRLLKATAPDAVNTMSLSGHGAMTCVYTYIIIFIIKKSKIN
jgi:hypothetical protein